MKRIILAIFGLLLSTALPVMGQDNNLVTLNDATPAINVNVSLPPDATGVVALNLSMAAVTVTDAQGNTVFQMTDPRVHVIELSLAPNGGTHVIRVERLPGVAEAAVSVQSQADLTNTGLANLVLFDNLSLNQERQLPLSPGKPGETVNLNIPLQNTGVVTATFLGGNVTSQVVDKSGAIIATSSGGGIDGLNMLLDGGEYAFTVLGNNLPHDITASVQVMPADALGTSVLSVPASTVANTSTTTTTAVDNSTIPQTTSNANCTATIATSSVNLRSGPGTGYSVLDYGYRDQAMAVGGVNPEQNWLLVGTAGGAAWVARNLIYESGECNNLTVFNIPLRDAQPATIIVQSVPNQSFSQSSGGASSSSFGEREHESEHGDEHEGGEHEDD
ncbi:MAG: hypothetical protein R3E39_29610 [Anaerolineae bacterium]